MKKEISVTQYQEGIFDVCEFLVFDLIEFLKEEGRYKYKMIDYMKTVNTQFNSAHTGQTEEDVNIYGRVLYVVNGSIVKEYQRLRSRRLTPADSLICIIFKLLEISESLGTEESRVTKEIEKVKGIFKKLYDNIRHKAKNDKLHKIDNTIKDAVSQKRWGTLSLDQLDIIHVEHPAKKEPEIEGERKNWGTTGKEVSF